MGLPVSVEVRRPARDMTAAFGRAFDWLRDVDARFSPFRTDSEVSRAGRGELGPEDFSREFTEILRLCAEYERRSGGAFKARLPGRPLDPSGVVKGWAVQRMAELLIADGAEHFCLNAGGDVITRGEAEPGVRWRVGVRHPERGDRMCAVFRVRDAAVATSGAYERGQHILDGRTGRPAGGLLCITVLADDLVTADATATAAFAQGTNGIAWAARQPGCLVFAIDARHRVHRSANLDNVLIP